MSRLVQPGVKEQVEKDYPELQDLLIRMSNVLRNWDSRFRDDSNTIEYILQLHNRAVEVILKLEHELLNVKSLELAYLAKRKILAGDSFYEGHTVKISDEERRRFEDVDSYILNLQDDAAKIQHAIKMLKYYLSLMWTEANEVCHEQLLSCTSSFQQATAVEAAMQVKDAFGKWYGSIDAEVAITRDTPVALDMLNAFSRGY